MSDLPREFDVTQGGNPQVRLLALTECGTHAIIDAWRIKENLVLPPVRILDADDWMRVRDSGQGICEE